MAELRIALLGPPRVERDGAPIEVDTRKAIALLAYLAMHPDGTAVTPWPGCCGPTTTPSTPGGRCGAPCRP
jgi:hypothetical protein